MMSAGFLSFASQHRKYPFTMPCFAGKWSLACCKSVNTISHKSHFMSEYLRRSASVPMAVESIGSVADVDGCPGRMKNGKRELFCGDF